MIISRLFKHKGSFLALLVLLFLTTVLFREYLWGGKVPFPANLLVSFYSPWRQYEWEGYPNGPPNKPIGFDNLRLFYPYRKLITEQLKKGEWPFWNPYNFSGNIHLATYQAPVFYPLNLIYFLLPQIDAWSILVVIQPILAGLFTYLFLRKINLSFKASFLGSIGFAFSGWMMVWLEEDLVKEHSILWLPLILYAIEKLRQKITPGGVILLVFATVSAILAGFLQLTLYLGLAVLSWLIFRFLKEKKKNYRLWKTLGTGFLFSLMICSAHLWPAIQAYFLSPRGQVDVKFLFEEYLMPFRHLLTFLAPDFWGNPGAYNYFGTGFYHEKMIYLGIPILVLALFAFFSKSNKKELSFFKWFSLLTLGLGFVPLGWFLYYSGLPLFTTMIPSRIFILPTFGFCVMAAFGIDLFLKEKSDKKIWKIIFVGLGLVFIFLWSWVFYQRLVFPESNYARVSFRNLVLPTIFFLATALIVIVSNWRFLKIKKSLIFITKYQTLFIFLLLTQIFSSGYFAQKYLYFSERRFVFPKVGVIEKLQEIAGINRIWGYGNAYIENNLLNYFDLLSPEGYDALFSFRYGQLLYLSETTNGRLTSQIGRGDANIKPASEREGVLDNWYRKRLLSLLGVKYVIESKTGEGKNWLSQEKRFPPAFFRLVWEDSKFRIWEYLEVLPRVFLATDYLVAKDDQEIIERLFDSEFELGKKVILEKDPGLDKENDIYKDE